jgi:hypothetical protein
MRRSVAERLRFDYEAHARSGADHVIQISAARPVDGVSHVPAVARQRPRGPVGLLSPTQRPPCFAPQAGGRGGWPEQDPTLRVRARTPGFHLPRWRPAAQLRARSWPTRRGARREEGVEAALDVDGSSRIQECRMARRQSANRRPYGGRCTLVLPGPVLTALTGSRGSKRRSNAAAVFDVHPQAPRQAGGATFPNCALSSHERDGSVQASRRQRSRVAGRARPRRAGLSATGRTESPATVPAAYGSAASESPGGTGSSVGRASQPSSEPTADGAEVRASSGTPCVGRRCLSALRTRLVLRAEPDDRADWLSWM